MSDIARFHIERVKGATVQRLRMEDLPRWLEINTSINGRKWSFTGHEYQQRILEDTSQECVVRKCSQVGLSELSVRMALGLVALMPSYTCIYTLPTASFAAQFVKGRVDPVIEGSPYLKEAISRDIDSSEVKKIGRFGYVYFKGAQSGNAAISVPADHLIHDEVSFSDSEILGQYHSRLTHSPHKRKTKLSTPTFPGDAIDTAFQKSRRHWLFCKCHHCGHQFIPNYYDHVKIPGYSDDLRKITGNNLHTLRYQEAALLCPKCGRVPSLMPEHREWICENPTETFSAAGYQVQPFDAPTLITVPYLIESSTAYARHTDFTNFNLGLTAEDADSGLQESDLDAAGIQLDHSPFHTHVIGFDQGIQCRLFVAGMTQEGTMVIVHSEEIPVQNLKKRYRELCIEYRVLSKVGDSQPYVETIMSMQEEDANLYGAFFVRKEKLELYATHTRQENIEEGKTALRDVQINRNKAFDMLMEDVRSGAVKIRIDDNWAGIKAQCVDMKRVKMLNAESEFGYNWVKSSKKNDHWHHALLYTWIAMKLRGTAQSLGGGAGSFGVHKFKMSDSAQRLPGDRVRRK